MRQLQAVSPAQIAVLVVSIIIAFLIGLWIGGGGMIPPTSPIPTPTFIPLPTNTPAVDVTPTAIPLPTAEGTPTAQP